MDVEPKKGVVNPPNHPMFNRVFHDFYHPFWGTIIFGNTHIGNHWEVCVYNGMFPFWGKSMILVVNLSEIIV